MNLEPRATLFVAATVALVGCGDPDPRSDWITRHDTAASGTVHVTHFPPANISPTWDLTEELRVGSLEGAGPDAFAFLKGLVAFDGGGFAVLDSEYREVRVFGPDGSHVATHGRRGQGPGEFVNPNGLMLDSLGRLWVPDPRGARMSVFDPEDGFIEAFHFATLYSGWAWNGRMVGGGRIHRPDQDRAWVRVYDLTMTLADSLPLFADHPDEEDYDPENPPDAFYQEFDDGSFMYRAIPYRAYGPSFIDSRGAVWSARAGDPQYRIVRVEPGGDTTLVIETRRPAVRVPEAERDSVIGDFRQMLADRGVSRQWDWSRIPTVKPAVESIFESPEGNLWVRTPSTDGSVLYDVYSEQGDHQGTAALAPGIAPSAEIGLVVKGDVVWFVVTDEFDVHHVVRTRMTPAG